MKTKIALVLIGLAGFGAFGWVYRIDLLLMVVKYQSQREFEVSAHREIDWPAGPNDSSIPVDARPPNVVLIVADDLGYNDISTFGGGVAGGRVQTPGIDQLAAEGAVFRQAYSGSATCAPSRAMIMTGRYPTSTGLEFTPTPSGMAPMIAKITDSMDRGLPATHFNKEAAEVALPYELQGLPADEVTVAEVLKTKGYQTAHIGKWHLGRSAGSLPHDQGFDDSLLMASGLFLPEDDPNVVNAKLPFDPIDQFLWARMVYAASFNTGDVNRFRPKGYLTDYWTDESIKFIRANRNRPFFLYLAHWATHTPLQATREDYEAVGDIKPHRLRVYAAMVRALDRSVARITETLEAEGLANNTVIIFTSDNGGAGYLGLPELNAPYRGWKLTAFEGGIRAPLFIKWPQRIPQGTAVETPVAHIDLMPTVASAAGASTPEGIEIDGIDLLPLATGQAEDDQTRTLFWHSGYYRIVRHGDWKLQVSERPNKQWLYNLAEDPTEQHNLAQHRPDKVAELVALLDQHKEHGRPPLYPYVMEIPVAVDKTLAEGFVPGDEFIYWPN
ncbi:sulfatase [Spongiibacter sp. KMU-166]|uniref:Sulfatase n=1 Tax=Spongiibacter thalassae TaxID=2721624 RepID=A0ABX1GEA3_9GAMM|nr:sulfatase [Spongiibacter thalassae]NKI16722.1 sulfatase [Spongiibacter thalassae]